MQQARQQAVALQHLLMRRVVLMRRQRAQQAPACMQASSQMRLTEKVDVVCSGENSPGRRASRQCSLPAAA